jgi:hypothetical protein
MPKPCLSLSTGTLSFLKTNANALLEKMIINMLDFCKASLADISTLFQALFFLFRYKMWQLFQAFVPWRLAAATATSLLLFSSLNC